MSSISCLLPPDEGPIAAWADIFCSVCGEKTRSSWSVSGPHQRQAASLIMGLVEARMVGRGDGVCVWGEGWVEGDLGKGGGGHFPLKPHKGPESRLQVCHPCLVSSASRWKSCGHIFVYLFFGLFVVCKYSSCRLQEMPPVASKMKQESESVSC